MTAQQIKDAALNLADTAKEAGVGALDDAKSTMAEAKARLSNASSRVAEQISSASQHLSDKLSEDAEDAADAIADKGASLAGKLRRAAKDQTDDSVQQKVLGAVANTVSDASGSLRGASLGSVVEGAQDFARRNPATVMAGAAVIGFALARFLRPSSGRRS